jgi:hypothetical protein
VAERIIGGRRGNKTGTFFVSLLVERRRSVKEKQCLQKSEKQVGFPQYASTLLTQKGGIPDIEMFTNM